MSATNVTNEVRNMRNEMTNVVNEMLDDLRKANGYTAEKVAKESKRIYEQALQTKVYGKIFTGVPLELIYIDERYQRTETFSQLKGDRIAAHFSENAYEPVKLNYRDGAFWCPSGQHRVYAHLVLKRDFIVAELTQCTRKEEIAVFLYQDDNRSKLTPYDRWKAGCELGDTVDVALKEVCQRYGITVAKTKERGCLNSITSAQKIIKLHGTKMLCLIFDTIKEAGWTGMDKAYDSRVIRALCKTYSYHPNGKRQLVNYFKGKTPMEIQIEALHQHPREVETAMKEFFAEIAREKKAIEVLHHVV